MLLNGIEHLKSSLFQFIPFLSLQHRQRLFQHALAVRPERLLENLLKVGFFPSSAQPLQASTVVPSVSNIISSEIIYDGRHDYVL